MTPILALAAVLAGDFDAVFRGGVDHPAVGYTTKPARNAVTAAMGSEASFRYDEKTGYLRSVLAALDVPLESQIVVFSKTSLMQQIISPENPRTIYFNDTVAVGWVPGESFVEIAALDAELGTIFYTVRQHQAERPRFERSNGCLTCHESLATVGVPGMLLRSVHTDSTGRPIRSMGDFVIDHRSPFGERWGGWFVTGKRLPPKHLGNPSFARNSDVVALMVFDHQIRAANLLTRTGWEARLALHEGKPEALPELAKELADYLLFVGEAPLAGKVEGSSGFAEKFAARGPLREFDLTRRLFRVPCSYMIYSPAFEALPAPMREAVYRRMWQVMAGFRPEDRAAVVRILRETKKDLPDYFR